MTILEERLRKNQKSKFLGKRPTIVAVGGARPALLTVKRQRRLGQQQRAIITAATTTTATTPLRERHRNTVVSSITLFPAWMQNFSNSSNNNNMWQEPMQENRMELDMLTVRVIKSQVLNLLSDASGRGWCTMLDVCMALKGSHGVKNTLMNAQPPPQALSSSSSSVAAAATVASDHQHIWGRGGYFKLPALFSAKHRKQQRQNVASMQQMYRFMAALDALQATHSSSESRISTWEDALEELKTVFRFSPRALQDLQRQEQDDHYFDKNDETAANFHVHDDIDGDQNYDNIDADAAAAVDKTTTTYVDDLLNPMADFKKRCHDVQDKNTIMELKESTKRWLQVMAAKVPAPPIRDQYDATAAAASVVELDAADLALEQRLQRQKQKVLQRQVPRAVQEAEARMRQEEEEMEQQLAEQARQAEARERVAALMRPFTEEENKQVRNALYTVGQPDDEIIAQAGTDSVQRGSLRRLLPGQVSCGHFFI